MTDTATVIGTCPHCGNTIEIDKIWEPGGVNDYGGYALQCLKCRRPFHLHLGRDIQMSRVRSGAKVLDTYDDERGHKDEVLKRHGIEP